MVGTDVVYSGNYRIGTDGKFKNSEASCQTNKQVISVENSTLFVSKQISSKDKTINNIKIYNDYTISCISGLHEKMAIHAIKYSETTAFSNQICFFNTGENRLRISFDKTDNDHHIH